MTNAPADLLAMRADILAVTGLAGNAVGVVGDGAHRRTGGYHEGVDVLRSIGRFHPRAAPGDRGEDYSARTARDRRGLTDDASAMDIGDDWPKGGRKAWLRFNNLLIAELRANDPRLAAIRGVNYTPDGQQRLRVDRERGWQQQSSTDTVTIHTHVELYRDTEGGRGALHARLLQLAHQAIYGTDGGDFLMALDEQTQRNVAYTLLAIPDPNGGTSRVPLHVWCAVQDRALDAIAAKVGLDGAELAAIRQAALEGAEAGVLASADTLVTAILGKLGDGVALTKADVETAVRAVFASAGQ